MISARARYMYLPYISFIHVLFIHKDKLFCDMLRSLQFDLVTCIRLGKTKFFYCFIILHKSEFENKNYLTRFSIISNRDFEIEILKSWNRNHDTLKEFLSWNEIHENSNRNTTLWKHFTSNIGLNGVGLYRIPKEELIFR